VRKVIGCLVIALVAAGCRGTSLSPPHAQEPTIRFRESPSPFTEVTAGPLSAVIPDRWRAKLGGTPSDPEHRLIASPNPREWWTTGSPEEGFTALWVVGTEVGVPSDYYYLAATGPALDLLTDTAGCSATRNDVLVNHRPTFANGPLNSPGDYVAVGQGICVHDRGQTRWASFVAAPGYGPVRRLGIPTSGLYVVVAMIPDSPKAPALLQKLLYRTRFGGASVSDFIAAARTA
jgi:hypothetical protein